MPLSRSLLINRDHARLWYGQAVSTVGDYVFDTTLVLWVATVLARGRSWAPAAVSGILLAVGAAVLLVGPVAGVFVDRWNRRATMLRTEVVRAVLVTVLLLLSLLPTGALPIWLWLTVIYLVVFVLNAAGQFFSPARFATVGDVVDGEADRAWAAGIGQATAATASIVGPPLAAPLLFTVGIQWALLANVVTYVVSYVAIRSVRAPHAMVVTGAAQDQAGSTIRAEFAAGLRFFRRNRFLVALVSITVIAACGDGALSALDVFFVTDNLHASSRLYGFMSMAFGVGAILGSLWAARVVRWFGTRSTTWLGLVVAGVLVFGYARQTAFPAGLVLLALVSIPVAMLNTAMTPLLPDSTPPQYLGRMIAVFNPINRLASMLSVVAAGWLASTVLHGFTATVVGTHIGPIDTIFATAGILIVLAGVYACLALPRQAPGPAPTTPG